jgi:hypothetical protein
MALMGRLRGREALLAPEGLLLPMQQGYACLGWDTILEVRREDDAIGLLVDNQSDRDGQVKIFTIRCRSREGWPVAHLADGDGFFDALSLAAGLQPPGPAGGPGLYRCRKQARRPPRDTLHFALLETEEWPPLWPPDRLARLSAHSGVTLNQDGVALVTPYEVSTVVWPRAQELDVYEGLPGVTAPQLCLLDHPKDDHTDRTGLIFNAEDRFYLDRQSMAALRDLLSELVATDPKPPPPEAVFFPLSTREPQWVEPAPRGRQERQPQAEAVPAPAGLSLWPSGAPGAGLYILPDGFMQVRGYVVERARWSDIDRLDGSPDGQTSLNGDPGQLFPLRWGEIAAYRSAREDMLEAAGLSATGLASPMYSRLGPSPGPVPAPHLYRLSPAAEWQGLPLSVLGEKPWPNGLYFLPAGLISIQDRRIGLAPWEDIQRIGIAEWDSDGLQYLRVQLPDCGFRAFPSGASAGQVALGDNSFAAYQALSRYLDLEAGPQPHLRPLEERPGETLFVPYPWP